jgi:hypothetical protein
VAAEDVRNLQHEALDSWDERRPPFAELGTWAPEWSSVMVGKIDRSQCGRVLLPLPLEKGVLVMDTITYGLDIAKRVFQSMRQRIPS